MEYSHETYCAIQQVDEAKSLSKNGQKKIAIEFAKRQEAFIREHLPKGSDRIATLEKLLFDGSMNT